MTLSVLKVPQRRSADGHLTRHRSCEYVEISLTGVIESSYAGEMSCLLAPSCENLGNPFLLLIYLQFLFVQESSCRSFLENSTTTLHRFEARSIIKFQHGLPIASKRPRVSQTAFGSRQPAAALGRWHSAGRDDYIAGSSQAMLTHSVKFVPKYRSRRSSTSGLSRVQQLLPRTLADQGWHRNRRRRLGPRRLALLCKRRKQAADV